jgi:primosomal protein N' (replication factor Y)
VTLLRVPTIVAAKLSQLELPAKQLQALKILAASPQPLTPQQLSRAARCSLAPIQRLREQGLLVEESRRVRKSDLEDKPFAREQRHELNPDQQRTLDRMLLALNSGRHQTLLIHGVTGSGKTEVYTGHRGDDWVRSASDRAGTGNQLDAADLPAIPRPL